MRYRSGQVPTATIIVASIFALMFIGTVTFFVYQFQHAGSNKNTKNKNTNKNTNTVVTNANTNTTPTTDLSPLNPIPDAWTTYSSTLAPYTIRYPKEWTLEEVIVPNDPVQKVPVKYARLSDPTGQVVLSLGVRKVGAITGIGDRTAAPTGTTSTGTALTVGGVSITGTNLVSEGNKVVAMFYYPIKPFGFSYVQGYEVQSEINLITVPGVTAPISDLSATTLTQIANTILSSLSFTGSSSTTPPPPVTIPPLEQTLSPRRAPEGVERGILVAQVGEILARVDEYLCHAPDFRRSPLQCTECAVAG
jgi:hypothetical protein